MHKTQFGDRASCSNAQFLDSMSTCVHAITFIIAFHNVLYCMHFHSLSGHLCLRYPDFAWTSRCVFLGCKSLSSAALSIARATLKKLLPGETFLLLLPRFCVIFD